MEAWRRKVAKIKGRGAYIGEYAKEKQGKRENKD